MKLETYEALKQHKKELEAKVITKSPLDLLREAVLTLIDALVDES